MSNKFNKLKSILLCTAFVALAACGGDPTMDASSDQAMQDSMVKIGKTLSTEKQLEFGQAVGQIMLSAAEGASDAEDVTKKAREKIHGKTADQIIAMSKELKK